MGKYKDLWRKGLKQLEIEEDPDKEIPIEESQKEAASSAEKPTTAEENISESRDDKIRITMLGTTSSGKTAFLSAVYQSLIMEYRSAFHLGMNDAYKESGGYGSIESIAMLRADGTVRPFAVGTSETKKYGLILYKNNETYCEFEFIDYRGDLVRQVLPEYMESENATDDWGSVGAEMLRKQLVQSNCILLFLDAVKISQCQDPNKRMKTQMLTFNRIFTDVLKDSVQQDVIAVLTKIDDSYVLPEDKENHYRGLCEKAAEVCGQLAERSRSFSIIPVSAVGEGNTITREEELNGQKTRISMMKPGVFPEPLNVDLTILYACRIIMQREMEELKKEIEQDWIRLGELERKSSKEEKIYQRPLRIFDKADIKYQWNNFSIKEKEAVLKKMKDSIDDIERDRGEDFETYVHILKPKR